MKWMLRRVVMPLLPTIMVCLTLYLMSSSETPSTHSNGAPRFDPAVLSRVEAYKILSRSPKHQVEPDSAWIWAAVIVHAAGHEGVQQHVGLLARQLLVESGGNPLAVSRVGASGLMQIMPAVWWERSAACSGDIFRPETNIGCGVHVFAYYWSLCAEDIHCTLNRYWGGYGRYADQPSPYTDEVL